MTKTWKKNHSKRPTSCIKILAIIIIVPVDPTKSPRIQTDALNWNASTHLTFINDWLIRDILSVRKCRKLNANIHWSSPCLPSLKLTHYLYIYIYIIHLHTLNRPQCEQNRAGQICYHLCRRLLGMGYWKVLGGKRDENSRGPRYRHLAPTPNALIANK